MELNHFEPHEFRCQCGECGMGLDDMQPDLLLRVDDTREIAGVPMVVTSSIRCPEWNRKVGGVDSSAHVSGYAVDIAANSGAKRWTIVRAAMMAGFNRIGIAANFVHLDCDPSKSANVIWTY